MIRYGEGPRTWKNLLRPISDASKVKASKSRAAMAVKRATEREEMQRICRELDLRKAAIHSEEK